VAEEKLTLDPRIELVAEFFARRSCAGSVSFPDQLVVSLATPPVSLAPPSKDATESQEEREARETEERRAHYSTLYGRPVTNGELERLP